MNPTAPLLHLTRPSRLEPGPLPGDWLSSVQPNPYEPVLLASLRLARPCTRTSASPDGFPLWCRTCRPAAASSGALGVTDLSFWLHKLVFVDAVAYLTGKSASAWTLTDYILVDIDDIFVGKEGTRIGRVADVEVSLFFFLTLISFLRSCFRLCPFRLPPLSSSLS